MDGISNKRLAALVGDFNIRGPVFLSKAHEVRDVVKALQELQFRRRHDPPEEPVQFLGYSGTLEVYSNSPLVCGNKVFYER